jgi:PAS domain S-box-containing protein
MSARGEEMNAGEQARSDTLAEARYRATLASIGDGVISTDAQGRIDFMNPVAERLTGWSEGEARGRPAAEVFKLRNEETRAAVESPVARVIREGVVVGLANHTLLIARDGTERPIADSGAPIRDGEGAILGVVLVFRDQTDESAAGKALLASEEKFRGLFDNAQVGVYRSLLDGSAITALNQRLADIFGFEKEEMLASPATLRWADPQARQRMVEMLRERGELRDHELDIVTKGGAVRTVLASIKLYPSEGYLEGTAVDITERKRAVEEVRNLNAALEQRVAERTTELQQSKELLDQTGRLARVGGWEIDLERNELTWTDVVHQIHEVAPGFRPTVEAGIRFYAPEAVPVISEALRRVVEEGQPFDVELQLITAKKKKIWVRALGEANRKEGKATLVRGVFQDIDARKIAEIELQKYREHLEESNKELEAFSYSVSHDLRAPLRAIDGFTRILADDYASGLDDEAKRICSIIRENTAKMGRLIDDLLAFSRLGRTQIQPSEIDMGGMARAVYYEVTTPEDRDRIDLRLETMPTVVGDPSLMRQVWMNLLGNAVKFSSKRERIAIRLSGETRDGEGIFSVRDNGAGFDMRYVGKLFGVFQRLHSAREFAGTGVGLALVQRVIRRHGGRVWAEGELDRGATFTFALPRRG